MLNVKIRMEKVEPDFYSIKLALSLTASNIQFTFNYTKFAEDKLKHLEKDGNIYLEEVDMVNSFSTN